MRVTPTVYRHFPDRTALLEGLTARIVAAMDAAGGEGPLTTLDDLASRAKRGMMAPEAHPVEAIAEAMLNSDPRRLSENSRARSAAQSWLRMREEFGITGEESGPIVAWAITTLVNEIHAGTFPRATDATEPRA